MARRYLDWLGATHGVAFHPLRPAGSANRTLDERRASAPEAPAAAETPTGFPSADRAAIGLLLVALILGYAWRYEPTEPFFGDEPRHVMTSVFFKDALVDRPFADPVAYAQRYYVQYPALGLLVWPPLVHALIGAAMVVLGSHMVVAQGAIVLALLLSTWIVFWHVRRRETCAVAWATAAITAWAPLTVVHAGQVMLEVPALAFGLGALSAFDAFLEDGRTRNIWAAGLLASAAVLTRFDAAMLVAVFIGLAALRGRLALILARPVWPVAGVALVVTAPVVLLTAVQFGATHWKTIAPSAASTPTMDAWAAWTFYPKLLPSQVGVTVLLLAGLGLAHVLASRDRRRAGAPWLALALVTYVVFSAISEKLSRHVIWWVPAAAYFAAVAIDTLRARVGLNPRWTARGAAIVVGVTVWTSCAEPAPYVRGYRAAAEYVASASKSRLCLVDALLDGDFAFQLRNADPERRITIARGDKLLYTTRSHPTAGYRELAASADDILDVLYRYDPELLVIEERPPSAPSVPAAERLRAVLRERTDRFELVRSWPIDSNVPRFAGGRVDVYRQIRRNPTPERLDRVIVPGLGRHVESDPAAGRGQGGAR
ncbi:MAG: glycosyltransferase family 39 protein [Vicinamibacterales bacterium]